MTTKDKLIDEIHEIRQASITLSSNIGFQEAELLIHKQKLNIFIDTYTEKIELLRAGYNIIIDPETGQFTEVTQEEK